MKCALHIHQKLYDACWEGNTAEAKRVIAEGAPVDLQDVDGNTPLIEAARENNMTIARELAWSLCDLKIPNKEGKTAAEMAKEKGHDALAEYLANQAPREQVRLASCAYDAMTYSSTRLFSAWL